MTLSRAAWASAFVFVVFSTATADVSLTQKTTVEIMGMGGFEIAIVEKIKGRMDYMSATKTNLGIMATDSSSQNSIVIERLDKGERWMLDPAARTYVVFPLSSEKATVDSGAAEAAGDSLTAQEYEWTLRVDTLKDTVINGFACAGLRGIADGLSKNPPGQRTRLTVEVWKSRNVPGSNELVGYHRQTSSTTAGDDFLDDDLMGPIFGRRSEQLGRLFDLLEMSDGFTVQATITVATSVDLDGGLAAGTGDDSEAAATAGLVKTLFPGKAGEDGLTPLVTMHSEVTGIEVGPVDAAIFEIPEGYSRGF